MRNHVWRVTKPETSKGATFDSYLEDINYIYQNTDAQRDVTDVLLNLVSHASQISEMVRRGHSGGLLKELSDVTLWVLSLIAKLTRVSDEARGEHESDLIFGLPEDFTITEMIWNKYPYRCPACLERWFQAELGDVFKPPLRAVSDEDLQDMGRQLSTKALHQDPIPCQCLADASVERRNETGDQRATQLAKARRLRLKHRKKVLRLSYARAERERLNRTPKSLPAVEAMFQEIYRPNIEHLSLAAIAFHLQEEVGEVADALVGTYTYKKPDLRALGVRGNPGQRLLRTRIEDVEEELADVISWIHALIFKMQEAVRASNVWWEEFRPKSGALRAPGDINLREIIWLKYGDNNNDHLMCGDCKKDICNCDFLIARTGKSVASILSRA